MTTFTACRLEEIVGRDGSIEMASNSVDCLEMKPSCAGDGRSMLLIATGDVRGKGG